MAESRQRLIPWLIAKINSQDIPGLYWLDGEKTTFRIPWKHGGKQDWEPEHSKIFMEWAKHTGKYREGVDTPEWAKWKTRLRCAFNKAPDIVEIKERSDTEASNPFKVYKLKPKESNSRRRQSSSGGIDDHDSTSDDGQDRNQSLLAPSGFSNTQTLSSGYSNKPRRHENVRLTPSSREVQQSHAVAGSSRMSFQTRQNIRESTSAGSGTRSSHASSRLGLGQFDSHQVPYYDSSFDVGGDGTGRSLAPSAFDYLLDLPGLPQAPLANDAIPLVLGTRQSFAWGEDPVPPGGFCAGLGAGASWGTRMLTPSGSGSPYANTSKSIVKPEKKGKEEYKHCQPPAEPMLPQMLSEYNVSNSGELSEMATGSLTNSLKGIPSNDLLPGISDNNIHILSTGSNVSFSDQNINAEEEMDTGEAVEMDPGVYPTNANNGAPVTTRASPAHTRAFPTHPSPASSDGTVELALSPAMSDQSAGTMQATTPMTYPHTSSSPLQGDVPFDAPQLIDLGISVPGPSIELSETERKALGTHEVKILPSNLSLPSGRITLQVIGVDDIEPQIVVERQTDLASSIQGHEMYVRVQYLSEIVMEEYILGQHGCRLKYGSDSDVLSTVPLTHVPKILGPLDAQILHLPPPTGLIENEKQHHFTAKLLESTNRGFLVDCENGDIYVTRYCNTVIYYCNGETEQGVKIQRHERTKVFDFPSYQVALGQHVTNGSPEPSASVCLGIGQPCQNKNQTDNLLISCTIKSALACDLAEKLRLNSRQPVQLLSMDDPESSVEMPLDYERQYVGPL